MPPRRSTRQSTATKSKSESDIAQGGEEPTPKVGEKRKNASSGKVKDESESNKKPKKEEKPRKEEVKEKKPHWNAGPHPPGYSKPHEAPSSAFASTLDERSYGTLERGTIYFLYRPRVDFEDVKGIGEVAKFHILLVPHSPNEIGKKIFRNLIVGRKRLPSQEKNRHEVIWGEVVGVGDEFGSLREILGEREYETASSGKRKVPRARVAGRGSYLIRADEELNAAKAPKGSKDMSKVWDTFLVYELIVPHEIGEVQEELFIQEEGAFHLSVKEPSAPSNNPAVRTTPKNRRPIFPSHLQKLFTTKFIPANPPSLLNYPGAELLFIPSKHSVEVDVGEQGAKELEEEGEMMGRKVKECLQELGLKGGEWKEEPLEGHWA